MIDIVVACIGVFVLVICAFVAVLSEVINIKIKKKVLKCMEVVEDAYHDWKN